MKSLFGYFDLGIAARFGGIDRGHNFGNVGLDDGPASFAENDKGDFATGKVLLIADIPVSRYQYFKSCGFRFVQKLAVFQFYPSARGPL